MLGRDRVYFVLPSRAQGPKPRVPSDLAGITHGWYDGRLAAERPLAAVGPFCDEVRRCITARCDSESVVRGRLEARHLRAIGPDVPPEVEGDVAYAFEGVEFVVTGQRVRLRASARLSGRVNADTQIEGWGEHHDGIVYAISSMHSPEDNLTIRGVAHLRLPKDGHAGGYFLSSNMINPERPRPVVGDVKLLRPAFESSDAPAARPPEPRRG